MKKLLSILILTSGLIITNSYAETVYVNAKAVDQKIIDQVMNQLKKLSNGCIANW